MSTAAIIAFEPFDTLWFRDGRVFEQTDDGLAEARLVFPPSPSTLAGALAAALARLLMTGSDPIRAWTNLAPDSPLDRLAPLAGLPSSSANPLSSSGPFLATPTELWLPTPATLMRLTDAREQNQLQRSEVVVVATRQGRAKGEDRWLPRPIRLADQPASPAASRTSDLKQLDDAYIRASDLLLHMDDMLMPPVMSLPIYERENLFDSETRIGIQMMAEAGVAQEGMLYAGQHLRPKNDNGPWLCMELTGANPEMLDALDGTLAPVGGRGRICQLHVLRGMAALKAIRRSTTDAPKWRVQDDRIHFRLTALTPVPVVTGASFGLNPAPEAPAWLSGLRVDTAIMPSRPVPVGSWASFGGKADIRYVHRPGTTWFASLPVEGLDEVSAGSLPDALNALRFAPTRWGAVGFGRVVSGEWPLPDELTDRRGKPRRS